MTSNLYRMYDFELRTLVQKLQEEARQGNLTRAASSHSLNKILGELRQAEECANRLRTQRDKAVEEYEDTHKDLLIVESQVTAYRTRVDEGEAQYAILSKQWSSLLSHKNYVERQVGKLRVEVKELKSEAVSNRAHISFQMGRAEGGSLCVKQLKTQVEELIEEWNKAEAKVGNLSTIKADQAMRIVRDERDDLRARLNASIEQVNRIGYQSSLDEACLAASRQSVRELGGALACKERRIVELQEGHEQACQSRDYSQVRWEKFSKKNTELEAQLANTHRDLLTVESRVASLIERFETLQAEQNDQGKVSRLEQQLKTVTEAYNALHLETQAIINVVPTAIKVRDNHENGPLYCIYCHREFESFVDARDKEQHEMDCHWVELEEVSLWTEQDVLRAVQGETG
ncbi:hypothetical protein LCGC14_0275930 [marine sediment metagenome]|uniref:Uncharacterized protein n=1 Tax=marine sediment metagenome TaxID=412755 RepID=A0A0F9WIL2_9ZZZZ